MTSHTASEWQIWQLLRVARLPLRLIFDASRRKNRTQMRDVSESAYVHRMFDLVYGLRETPVLRYLTEDEAKAVAEFNRLFDALPWRPLPEHPHVSELPNDDLSVLEAPARRIDRIVWLRTGRGVIPIVYRLCRGWRVWEPRQGEESKPAQPGATDNPDDAQRI